MKADFLKAAEYADLADRELHFADRMASAAEIVEAQHTAKYRESELSYRIQAGHYRMLEKMALLGRLA